MQQGASPLLLVYGETLDQKLALPLSFTFHLPQAIREANSPASARAQTLIMAEAFLYSIVLLYACVANLTRFLEAVPMLGRIAKGRLARCCAEDQGRIGGFRAIRR
jgi:hypothetical protein